MLINNPDASGPLCEWADISRDELADIYNVVCSNRPAYTVAPATLSDSFLSVPYTTDPVPFPLPRYEKKTEPAPEGAITYRHVRDRAMTLAQDARQFSRAIVDIANDARLLIEVERGKTIRVVETGAPNTPALDDGPSISFFTEAEFLDHFREHLLEGGIIDAVPMPDGAVRNPGFLRSVTAEMYLEWVKKGGEVPIIDVYLKYDPQRLVSFSAELIQVKRRSPDDMMLEMAEAYRMVSIAKFLKH